MDQNDTPKEKYIILLGSQLRIYAVDINRMTGALISIIENDRLAAGKADPDVRELRYLDGDSVLVGDCLRALDIEVPE